MDYGKWQEAQQRIDWKLEGYFGYNFRDCHLCYGNHKIQSIIDTIKDKKPGLHSDLGLNAFSPSTIYLLGKMLCIYSLISIEINTSIWLIFLRVDSNTIRFLCYVMLF